MKSEVFRVDKEVETAIDALVLKLDRTRSDVLRRAVIHFAQANGIEVTT